MFGIINRILNFIIRLSPPPPKKTSNGPPRDSPDVNAREALSGANARPSVPSRPLVDLEGPGDFEIEVVGESFYQENIESIAGPKTREGFDLDVVAFLVLEDDNPHDKNAVRVDINSLTVGYLNRENAKVYRKLLRVAKGPTEPLSVMAKIVGGWDKGGGDAGHFGVRIDLESK